MPTLPLAEMGSVLVHVHTLLDRRKGDIGTCSNPVCWQMCLQGVCIYANMLADVDTGWYMYQPAGAV